MNRISHLYASSLLLIFMIPNQIVSDLHKNVYILVFSLYRVSFQLFIWTPLHPKKKNIEPKSHPLQRKFIFGKSPFCGFHILVSRSIYIPKKPWKFFCRHPTAVACFWERSSGKQASKTYFRHCEGALGPTLAGWLEVFLFVEFHRFGCLGILKCRFCFLMFFLPSDQ